MQDKMCKWKFRSLRVLSLTKASWKEQWWDGVLSKILAKY